MTTQENIWVNIDCRQNGCYRYNISNSESLGDSGIGQFSDGVRISFITLSKPITIFGYFLARLCFSSGSFRRL